MEEPRWERVTMEDCAMQLQYTMIWGKFEINLWFDNSSAQNMHFVTTGYPTHIRVVWWDMFLREIKVPERLAEDCTVEEAQRWAFGETERLASTMHWELSKTLGIDD